MTTLQVVANISAIVSVVILLAITFIGIKHWIFSIYPFKMDVFVGKYDYKSPQKFIGSNIIEGVKELYPQWLTLKIKLGQERKFEQINVRFFERRLFRWVDASKNSVSVSALYDPQTEDKARPTGRTFHFQSDDRGGSSGFYNPPYYYPKGGVLFLLVPIAIKVKKKWVGCISFEHKRGDKNRRHKRKKIIIINKEIPLS